MSASSAVVNRLAAELHRNYRAAEKALNGPDKTDRDPSLKDGVTLRHDHGWESCHKQKYFRRRAQTLITRATCLNHTLVPIMFFKSLLATPAELGARNAAAKAEKQPDTEPSADRIGW